MQVNYILDYERSQRPWSAYDVDMIELKTDDGRKIGYMKLGHITSEKFEEHFPTVLHWLGRSKGWCGVDDMYDSKQWKELAIKLNCYDRSALIPDYVKTDYHKNVTDEEWKDYGRKAVEKITSKYSIVYENFRKYFVGNCYVDFANVEEKFRGQGYYIELYRLALEWCNKRGLNLYTSSLKSDLAQYRFDQHTSSGTIEISVDIFNRFHGDGKSSIDRTQVTNVKSKLYK